MEKFLAGEDGERARFMKVVSQEAAEDTQESIMVAFADWRIPTTKSEPGDAQEDNDREDIRAAANVRDNLFPKGADKANADERRAIMEAKTTEFFGEDWKMKYWYLSGLATLPMYQGRGAGTRLVRWGLDQARDDAKARPNIVKGIYTIATPAGLATYKKCGMVEVGEVVHDIGMGKEEGRYKLVYLIKELAAGGCSWIS